MQVIAGSAKPGGVCPIAFGFDKSLAIALCHAVTQLAAQHSEIVVLLGFWVTEVREGSAQMGTPSGKIGRLHGQR